MSKLKKQIDKNVLEAAQERIEWTFDTFKNIYVSYSGGKDSTVMVHLIADEARKRNKRFGILIVDLEGQYKFTIEHLESTVNELKDIADIFWVCLPLVLRNAVSVYEPRWICWDKDRKNDWIRELPELGISDEKYFDFFQKGMEFEEFVPLFGEWYAKGQECACLVGIRADESLNRFRTIASKTKVTKNSKQYTTQVTSNVYNVYPIYDWRTEDIWTYHGKNPQKRHNELYDYMHKAGVALKNQRICQPYGDDQRRGLWLFHLIEPQTWAKIVARVNGANSGALYIQENGNINGYNKIVKPKGHTWKSFAIMLANSMPPKIKKHYENKIILFRRWWIDRGYAPDIPDEVDYNLEQKRDVPSWRRICKSLLRNDYWCKGLGFSQHKSEAYMKYLALMERRKKNWGIAKIQDLFKEREIV